MKDQIKNLLSIHWILTITIATIAVLQFAIFGVVGLSAYFFLLAYNIVGLIYCWKVEKKRIYYCPVLFLGIAYCVMYMIASLVNGNFVNIATTIVQYLLILTLSFFIRPDSEIIRDVISISKILTVAGIAMSVLSVLLAVLGTAFPEFFGNLPNLDIFNRIIANICDIRKERLIGFGRNPNLTAFYCYVCAIASLFLFSITSQAWWKFFAVLNILFSGTVIIFLSNSRTYILALAVFACFFFFTYYLIAYRDNSRKRMTFKMILTFGLLCCLFTVIAILLNPDLKVLVFNKILRTDSIKTIGNREYIFESALEMGADNRLFGINSDFFESQVALHTHNMYLEIITFAGVPCFILFMCYLAFATGISVLNFKRLKNESIESKILNCFCFSFLFGYLAGGFTEPGGVSSMRLIFPVLQVIVATICVMHYNARVKCNSIK